jgi:hypothetical protein
MTNEFNAISLYDTYRAQIRMRDMICGGMPKNPELLKTWIASTTEHDDETTTAQEKEARESLLQPTEEKSWNTFPGDSRGLFVWSRQIKALFRECATMLLITTQKRGSKQIFQHGFEIKGVEGFDDRIYLGVTEPTGMYENPIHVQTPQGPRSAIKRVDYVHRPKLTFDIWVLTTAAAEKRHVGETELRHMLTFAQENGLGADRSQGRGKFDVLEFQRIKATS